MRYLDECYRDTYQLGWSNALYIDMGWTEQGIYATPITVMQETGIRASLVSPEPTLPDSTVSLYAGDIISFTIKGITHGPEREEVAAAHVWWCQEDACWAFGRWTQKVGSMNGGTEWLRTWDWWYTMQDRIDRATITLLGNVFEHPHLLPKLGYTPSL